MRRRSALKAAAFTLTGATLGVGGAAGAEAYRADHPSPTSRVSPLVLNDTLGSPTSIIWKGDSGTRRAALTFDDGPDPRWTPRALELLAKTGAKATFFMLGSSVAKYPEVARSVAEAGHEIGSHSWDHRHLTTLSARDVHDSLSRTHSEIVRATSQVPRHFRPPYGQFDAEVAWATAKLDYSIALWSHRMTADTPMDLAQRNVLAAAPGMILLSHDGRSAPTVEQMSAAEWMISTMKGQGWTFVSLSTLLEPAPTK